MLRIRWALCLLALPALVRAAVTEADVDALDQLRSKSSDGVIHLTEDLLKKFIVGRSRPYSAFVFFTANQVSEGNPNLRMTELRKEYGFAARAHKAGPDAKKAYFFEAALETSQAPFALFQVNALPFIVRVPGNADTRKHTYDLPRDDKLTPETIGSKDYPWPAETFVEHLLTKHGIQAAPVDRPSIYKSPFFPALVFGAVLAAAYVAWKAFTTQLLRHAAIWGVLSLAVFWFSVSGGMYNIIRGMPFFLRDRNGRIQFFLTSRQGQLGAEGFLMGSLYVAVSCCVAFITYLAPRISNRWLRDSLSLVGATAAAGGFFQVFKLWSMKTGYRHVFYL